MLAAFDQARLEANTLTIPMYIETTRTFIQLATGLLTVTILFREKVLHETRRTAISTPLALSWLSLLLSVGAGAIYQYRAVKFLESLTKAPGGVTWFDNLFESPAVLYAVMLFAFFAGVLFFIWAASESVTRAKRAGASN